MDAGERITAIPSDSTRSIGGHLNLSRCRAYDSSGTTHQHSFMEGGGGKPRALLCGPGRGCRICGCAVTVILGKKGMWFTWHPCPGKIVLRRIRHAIRRRGIGAFRKGAAAAHSVCMPRWRQLFMMNRAAAWWCFTSVLVRPTNLVRRVGNLETISGLPGRANAGRPYTAGHCQWLYHDLCSRRGSRQKLSRRSM